MKKPTLKERFNYWFDNRMSKGSFGLIRILVLVSVVIVMFLCGLIILWKLNDELTPFDVFWEGFATIINGWMPSYEDGSPGYVIIMAVIAIGGLLFTSVLIGLLTTGMEERIMNLRRGNSRVLENGHTIVLGFYPGEYTLLRQLVLAAGEQKSVIVVGADMERDELEQYINDNVAHDKNVSIICRKVDIFNPKSIERLSPDTSRTVLIAPTDDNSTIKTLLAVSSLIHSTVANKVRVNAMISKETKKFPESIARKHNITTLQTNDTLAKIIAHSSTQTGLSEVFKEIFNFQNSELYLIDFAHKEGLSFQELLISIDGGVPCGIYRDHEMITNPPADMTLQEKDRILVFAEDRHAAKYVGGKPVEVNLSRNHVIPEKETGVHVFGSNASLMTVLRELPENVSKVTLINYDGDQEEEIVSLCSRRNMKAGFRKGNIRKETDLLNLCKDAEHIVLLSGIAEDEEADMNTIFLLLNLRDLRNKYHLRYNITAEMRKEKNEALIADDDYIDFVVASNMSSLFLAQLAESPELRAVFRELLSNEGNELYMKKAGNLMISGTYTVAELRQLTFAQGYIFLGWMSDPSHYVFNPGLNDTLNIREGDSLIVFGEN